MRGEQRIPPARGGTNSAQFNRWSRNRETRMRPEGTVWCPTCGMVPILPATGKCRKCRLRHGKSALRQRRKLRQGGQRRAAMAIQMELFP